MSGSFAKLGATLKWKAEYLRLKVELKKIERLEIAAGFQAGKTEKDGADICSVAAWNEYGTSSIPSRPFIREGVENSKDKIQQAVTREVAAMAKGTGSGQQLLQKSGVMMKSEIKKSIKNGAWTPNAPSTIAKKGSSKPLIDTGRMRQSVNFEIREKGIER